MTSRTSSSRRALRSPRALAPLGGLVAAAAVTVAVTTWHDGAAAGETSPGPSATVVAADPDLATKQATGDELPGFLRSGPQQLEGLVTTSTRLLGQSDGATFWTGTNDAGQICLVSLLSGAGQFASMSCQDGDAVWQTGIGLQVHDAGHALRAYFVPDGFDAQASGLRSLGDHLLVGDASKAAPTRSLRAPGRVAHGNGVLKLPAFDAATASDLRPPEDDQ